jgi:Spy/CpxP family protein refolding chaperone
MTRSFMNNLAAPLLSLFVCAGLGAPALANPPENTILPVNPPITEKAEAAHKDWKSGPHHGKHRCGILKQLNLTDAQKETLKTRSKTFREENASAIAGIRAKRQELRALGTDPVNEAKRKALLSELRQERQALRAKHKAMMQGVLTPEQISQMEKAKAQCKASWKKQHNQ